MTFVAVHRRLHRHLRLTIAVAQWDIKRVLAYSTITQLGFMIAALGIGAYMAGLFHLITHAFFKALLFLGSGRVIHGVEHGFHHAHAHAAHDHDESLPSSRRRTWRRGRCSRAYPRPAHHSTAPTATSNPNDPQDMRNMGGLLKRMPITGWTFIIGGLALAGFPFMTAGFWSKDEILASCVVRRQHLGLLGRRCSPLS